MCTARDAAWAVALALAAVLLRLPLEPWLEGRLIYLTMFPLAAAVALRLGMCAGLVSVIAYMALAEVLLVPPWNEISLPRGPDLAVVMTNVIFGVALVLICAHFRAVRIDAEDAAVAARAAQQKAEQAAEDAGRADQELRRSEERFRLAARAARDIIYDLDLHTGQVLWNEALGVLGYPDRQQTDLDWWEQQIHDDDRDRVVRSLGAAFASKDPSWRAEYRFRRADGAYLDVLDRAYVMYDERGEPARLVGAMVDVTDSRSHARNLEDRAEALTRSNSDLEDFAYVVAHDLKEPLRGISTLAGLLREEQAHELSPLARDRLETLRRLPERMADQMDALLEFSRIGRTEFMLAPVDLQELLRDVLDQLSAWLCDKGAMVAVGELPTLRCDPARARQVFLNLIVNGVKYNHSEQKRIEVGTLPGTDPPVLFVRDNGIGIAPRHQQAVFGMFRRLHGRDCYGGGAGAGLALVRKIVQRHSGRIWIESAPGKGATFLFTLGAENKTDLPPAQVHVLMGEWRGSAARSEPK